MANPAKTSLTTRGVEKVVEKVVEALDQLRFGSIEITVHEGRVVQIERREKFRLENPTHT